MTSVPSVVVLARDVDEASRLVVWVGKTPKEASFVTVPIRGNHGWTRMDTDEEAVAAKRRRRRGDEEGDGAPINE